MYENETCLDETEADDWPHFGHEWNGLKRSASAAGSSAAFSLKPGHRHGHAFMPLAVVS